MSFLDGLAADLDTMLADWGEGQIWTPSGGAATPFTGVPEVNFKMIDLASGSVATHDAAVFGKKTVISAAKKGDAVALTSALNGVSSVNYTITAVQDAPEDLGPGFVRLLLKKA